MRYAVRRFCICDHLRHTHEWNRRRTGVLSTADMALQAPNNFKNGIVTPLRWIVTAVDHCNADYCRRSAVTQNRNSSAIDPIHAVHPKYHQRVQRHHVLRLVHARAKSGSWSAVVIAGRTHLYRSCESSTQI